MRCPDCGEQVVLLAGDVYAKCKCGEWLPPKQKYREVGNSPEQLAAIECAWVRRLELHREAEAEHMPGILDLCSTCGMPRQGAGCFPGGFCRCPPGGT